MNKIELKIKKPDHCNGCALFHNAGIINPSANQEKYNAWCSKNGMVASKAVSVCVTNRHKKPLPPLRGMMPIRGERHYEQENQKSGSAA